MNLDQIIDKFGIHALDIDGCKRNGSETTIYAYCHEHGTSGEFMKNHYLEVRGAFVATVIEVDDAEEISLHVACIEKIEEGLYEISGVGGWLQFKVNGELCVIELSEKEYQRKIRKG